MLYQESELQSSVMRSSGVEKYSRKTLHNINLVVIINY